MTDIPQELEEIDQSATQRIDALARDPLQPKPVRRAARAALRRRAEVAFANAAEQVRFSTERIDTLIADLDKALVISKGQPFGGALRASVTNLKSLRARLGELLISTTAHS
jgi:hypothetical protein